MVGPLQHEKLRKKEMYFTYCPSRFCFLHDYPLAVESGSTPRPLVQKKKLGEILYLLICSFLPCLSLLLRSRVRKSRRELRIILYIWNAVVIIFLYNMYKYTTRYIYFLIVFLRRYEVSVDRISDSRVAIPVSVLYYCPVVEYRDPYPIIFGSSYITLCI